MKCIEICGSHYGLSFNLQKIEMLKVKTAADVRDSSGELVTCKDSLVYLGTRLSADGRSGTELSNRIGAAGKDFKI
eukprot:5295887-Pyramimonas_sp.AAC.1